jgi:hypothetical protein
MAITEFGKPHEGAEFWPSQQSMAQLIGVSERTVRRHMDELIEARLIGKRPGGFGGTNRYKALIPNEDRADRIGEAANEDRADRIGEAANEDNSGINEDRADLSMRTGLTYEHTQEHTHSTDPVFRSPFSPNRNYEEATGQEDGRVAEPTGQEDGPSTSTGQATGQEDGPSTPSTTTPSTSPTDPANDPVFLDLFGDDEDDEPMRKSCGCIPDFGMSCHVCRDDKPRVSRAPEWKQRQWYERNQVENEDPRSLS